MTASTPLTTARDLLDALEHTGPRPVLAWYGEASRIELSGHVLANWVIKAIGHLHDEVMLEPGDAVLLDLAPHWKRLVLALAAWSLGADASRAHSADAARASDDGADGDTGGRTGDGAGGATGPSPQVLITDRPDSALADAADEVLALEAVSLVPRWTGELPPLVHDWVQEVRASPDQLGVALPGWSGPVPLVPEAQEGAPTRLLVAGDGLDEIEQVLGVFLTGGGIVGPAAAVSARQAEDEGVTAEA